MNVIDDLNKVIADVNSEFIIAKDEQGAIIEIFEHLVGWKRLYFFVDEFLEAFKYKISHEMINTMFFSAISKNIPMIFDSFLSRGADINGRGFNGENLIDSGLWIPRNSKYKEFLKRIIDLGWDVNSKSKYGSTILHLNFSVKFPDIIECLIENGADPYIPDGSGNNCFDKMNRMSGSRGIVHLRKIMKRYR